MADLLDLSIIIVNWNSAAFACKCLASICANLEGTSFEVIVVDNASFDGCKEMIREEYPQVKFIQSRKNLGFACANNLGFTHSTGRNLLFLNPDTEIQGTAIQTMAGFLEATPSAGIVGARLLNPDLSLQDSCIQRFPTILNQILDSMFLRRLFPRSSLWGMAPAFEPGNAPREVEVVSGACQMVRRQIFERVGLFTTAYFMYTEDVDLCFKVKQAGWKTYYVASAQVIHHGGQSSDSQPASNFSTIIMRESRMKFLRERRGRLYAAAYRVSMIGAATFRLFILVVVFAATLGRFHSRSLRRALVKWTGVFRWAVGLEGWVRESA